MDLHLDDLFEEPELGALRFSGKTSFGLSAKTLLQSPAVRSTIKNANRGRTVTLKKRTTTTKKPTKTTTTKKPTKKGGIFSALTLPTNIIKKASTAIKSIAKKPPTKTVAKPVFTFKPSFKTAFTPAKPFAFKPLTSLTAFKPATIKPLSAATLLKPSAATFAPPISETHPRAYRQLACNAGVGGDAAMTLLKQIAELVKLADTRAVATSEHRALNETADFRRAVLRGLQCKMQGARKRARR